ncbi:hypothetical protein HMPREF1861_01413 [Corynebacterium kroppenstedtii]|nr:hypothetical protein HMPREF1861_01413 [Corynebacterium kroppenstedtii]
MGKPTEEIEPSPISASCLVWKPRRNITDTIGTYPQPRSGAIGTSMVTSNQQASVEIAGAG